MIEEGKRLHWKRFCKEPLDKVDNYQQAEAENFKGWCIHHRLEIQPDGTRVSVQELKDKNLYYGRPASELVFMKVGEHKRLHWIGSTFNRGKQLSAETRQKMSEARKGKHKSAEHRKKIAEALKGKHLSEETCKKMSEAKKGKHLLAEHRKKLSEALKGKRWWNNGIEIKMSRECPGPEWKRGRLKVSMTNL